MSRPFERVGSTSPVFDGNLAVCWFINMTNSIEKPRFKNITPGVLYTFVFYQDAVGGHTMTWPEYINNPPMVNPRANAVTTVNLIGMSGEEISNVTGTHTIR